MASSKAGSVQDVQSSVDAIISQLELSGTTSPSSTTHEKRSHKLRTYSLPTRIPAQQPHALQPPMPAPSLSKSPLAANSYCVTPLLGQLDAFSIQPSGNITLPTVTDLVCTLFHLTH